MDPLFHAAPPARRGRPPGANAAVIIDPRSLGIHHFAFVRSYLLGLDVRAAFNRYLAWSETTTDLRYIHNRCDALLQRIIEAGRRIVFFNCIHRSGFIFCWFICSRWGSCERHAVIIELYRQG